MDTSSQNKLWVYPIALLLSLPIPGVSACEYFQSQIRIRDWNQPAPKSVYVNVINPSKPINDPDRTITLRYKSDISPAMPAYGFGPSLYLTQDENPIHRPSIHNNYIIVIDDVPTFHITDIESKRPELGCPVTSFKVNKCIGKLSPYLTFDNACR